MQMSSTLFNTEEMYRKKYSFAGTLAECISVYSLLTAALRPSEYEFPSIGTYFLFSQQSHTRVNEKKSVIHCNDAFIKPKSF